MNNVEKSIDVNILTFSIRDYHRLKRRQPVQSGEGGCENRAECV
jgi:hypothetical protein